MTGNVWEWITTNSPSNPANKICRGGSWATTITTHLSKIYRGMSTPTNSSQSFGFRVFTINNPYSLSNFVPVLDTFEGSGNPAETTSLGSVSYSYFASQEPVTNDQYAEFLNAIAATDTNNTYDTSMGSNARGGIVRSGTSGSYSYACKTNMSNKPVNYVMWYNAARYCNWLHNNKPTGLQSASTTEDGAYILNGNIGLPNKFANARYFLPSENEWYKAAYYASLVLSEPTRYYTYATKSDTLPSCVSATATGDGAL
jgi:formylglycine-generating enzyme required for sulfatase activity